MRLKRARLRDIQANKRWALNGGPFGSKLGQKDYVESGVPVIRGCNLSMDAKFNADEFVFVTPEKADELLPNNAHPGDLVFTQRGTLGQVGIIPDSPPYKRFVISQSQMKLTADPEKADARYIYYVFRTPDVVSRIHNQAFSSGVPHINLEILRDFELDLPSVPVQTQIADILSAYDDLIENNARRIRILEQIAQMIHREWFVNFRFPGGEKLPLVGSILGDIPEGWEIADLASVCVERNGIQTGPFGSQLHMADYSDEGVPVVMPKDLIGFRIRTDEIARIPESIAEKLSRHRMQPDDIVYGRRGDIGRRAYLMPGQAGWFCGTGCLRIRSNSQAVNSWYLFNYLGQDDVQGIIVGRALGVTMPNLNTGVMTSVPVKLPPRDLQDAFARLTFPMAEAREVLTAAIENLCRTRDLLLPKLVSGEVSVERIEAEVPAQTV